jgi:hypothetical protein
MKHLFLILSIFSSLFLFSIESEKEKAYKKALLIALKDDEARQELISTLEKDELISATNQSSKETINKGFLYLKTGVTTGSPNTDPNSLIGIGYRTPRFYTNWAVDINFQSSMQEGDLVNGLEVYIPKMGPLFYFSPQSDSSLYLGIASATMVIAPSQPDYISTETHDLDSFLGTAVVLTLGYQLNLKSRFLNSFQLELNIPQEATSPDQTNADNITLNFSYCIGY